MSTQAASPPTDDGRWEFLEDTYWYVPTPYLPAVVLVNTDPPHFPTVVDQTLWHITSVINGNVIGEVATTVGQGWGYSTLVGSITPSGEVSFSFTPTDPTSDITVGKGTMSLVDGAWFFEMQMTTGTGAANITHWAYMAQSTPDDRAWLSLPGYPGTGIAEAFDDDPTNDGGSFQPLDLIFGTDGDDVMAAAAGSTGVLLFGEGANDSLTGSDAADGLVGGAGRDKVTGGEGADDVYGESGADRGKGGKGDDYLDGGKGRDALSGGDGIDTLHGGNGADRFIVASVSQSTPAAPDTIDDFSRADGDGIDLSRIDAKPGVPGNDAFSFIGEKAFTGQEGELRYERSGGNTVVYGDTDGDGVADFAIVLVGGHTLKDADFLL